LVATDGSKEAEAAVDYAITLAKRTGASLQVLSVALPTGGAVMGPTAERAAANSAGMRGAKSAVEAAVKRAKGAGVAASPQTAQAPDPAPAIVQRAEDLGTTMIIMGSRGMTGIKRVLLGSVAERVVELAHCPVLVVR
jgi:nucleotide-binding universal stress UspA family protein